MSETQSNGRASIREVHALVGKVDGKVDKILAAQSQHETRLAVIEKTCRERPRQCSLEHAAARRKEREDGPPPVPAEVESVDPKPFDDPVSWFGKLLDYIVDTHRCLGPAHVPHQVCLGGGRNAGAWSGSRVDRYSIRFGV